MLNFGTANLNKDFEKIDNKITSHNSKKDNPHIVSKAQVGLGNCDNTSDVNKPISSATQIAINNHVNNKVNPHAVTKAQVGLGNCDNTSDANKPISSAAQIALNGKVNTSLNNVASNQNVLAKTDLSNVTSAFLGAGLFSSFSKGTNQWAIEYFTDSAKTKRVLCIQWGYINVSRNGPITLLKAFANTDYVAFIVNRTSGASGSSNPGAIPTSTTTFSIDTGNGGNSTQNYFAIGV